MKGLVSFRRILITFLKNMADDLTRRSFDEQGDQKEETLGRVEELKKLIAECEQDFFGL